jgi:uncharacterized protein
MQHTKEYRKMLYLQELAKQGQQSKTVTLTERVPHFIATPCELNVNYHVETREDFYLINLEVRGELTLLCQRCMDDFNYSYENNTIIAVCRDDARAEQLLERYECIVASNLQVSLEDLIIDELHLYAPQFHPEIEDCGNEINQFLT